MQAGTISWPDCDHTSPNGHHSVYWVLAVKWIQQPILICQGHFLLQYQRIEHTTSITIQEVAT